MLNRAGPKRLIGTAFLLCFLFYAVSPLSSSVIQNNEHGLWARPAGPALKSIRLFLLEMFVSQFSNAQSDPNDGAPSITFYLLQKKKVVVPSKKNTYASGAPISEGLAPWNHVPGWSSVSNLFTSMDGQKAIRGFRLLYSGLSPPPVRISCQAASAGYISV